MTFKKVRMKLHLSALGGKRGERWEGGNDGNHHNLSLDLSATRN